MCIICLPSVKIKTRVRDYRETAAGNLGGGLRASLSEKVTSEQKLE